MSKILTLLSLLLFLTSFGQEETKFSPAQLQSDFDLFVETFLNVHPAPYEFIKQSDLKIVENTLRASLDHDMTELEFQIIIRKYIKHIGCGHTMSRPSAEWYSAQRADSKVLPISYYLVNNELYVKKAYRCDSVLTPGTRIFTVNDIAVDIILEQMREIHERDGLTESFVNAKIEKSFSTYFLFLYGNSDIYHLSYQAKKTNIKVISIEAGYPSMDLNTDQKPKPKPSYLFSLEYEKFWIDTLHPKVAILDINSFQSDGFKKFYKNTFKEIREKNIDYLVIDLRGNGGGYFPNGNNLLTYLIPEKFEMKFSRPKTKVKKNKNLNMAFSAKVSKFIFNTMPDRDKTDPHRNYSIPYKPNKKYPFSGKVFILTDGYSFSLGGLVPAVLKDKINATIVGEETGGGENGSYAVLKYFLTLPETKIRIALPHYFIDHDVTPKLFGRGVIPDYVLPKTIEDKLSPEDEDLEKVYELIEVEK